MKHLTSLGCAAKNLFSGLFRLENASSFKILSISGDF